MAEPAETAGGDLLLDGVVAAGGGPGGPYGWSAPGSAAGWTAHAAGLGIDDAGRGRLLGAGPPALRRRGMPAGRARVAGGMDSHRQGLAYGAGAYLLWGLFPVYWPLLEPSGSIEILAHRIVWSLLLVAGLLTARRQWGWVRGLGARRAGLLAVAAAVVSANWAGYIWGVTHGHVVETSLGYFINPLVTVLLAVLVLGERLRRAQLCALGLGAVAVVVLAVDYGRPPWLALLLAFSFGTYGLVKKSVGIGALESLATETAMLALPAAAYLAVLAVRGESSFGAYGAGHASLLVVAGPVTAVPLLLFGAAARRLPLSVLGLLQYLAPVLQFGFGVLLFHEPMPPARLAGFALVWLALVLLTAEGLRSSRRQRRAQTVSRSSTVPPELVTSNDSIRSRGSGATAPSP